MNINNQIFLAFVLILLNGCNSKNSKIESTSQKNEVEVSPEFKRSAEKSIKKEFKLTDDNVIEFLFDYEKSNKENLVRIYTPFGEIDILLYNNTPYHRSNFIYLTKKKYFEGTQFYRVINDFVIQAGNSDNIKVSKKRRDIGKYLLPNDFNKGHTHKRGMVSMPSSSVDNPYKMASPFEFFIVQKKDGAHHLNGNYTIFGEVIDGMETVDIIANLPTDNRDWPLNNVYINKVEIID
ncbi:peptidylprolyl isomerase [Flavobacteriaceae bacterium]|nr:peptidylprolyl isomerase [Flavobacteriaceae bacterium]